MAVGCLPFGCKNENQTDLTQLLLQNITRCHEFSAYPLSYSQIHTSKIARNKTHPKY